MNNGFHTLRVELPDYSYPIYIGSGLLGNRQLINSGIIGDSVAIISDETVAPEYLPRLQSALNGRHCDCLIVPAGEIHKNLSTIQRIYELLAEKRHGRDTTLIALGGGVVGDMTGFAAATWHRGVNFIQCPTTLLAQVDSSVGGKTGVNLAAGKNLVGAFHQPVCVICDISVLDSLPDREYRSGLAEVIKYGLMRDARFFDWLEKQLPQLMARDPSALQPGSRKILCQ